MFYLLGSSSIVAGKIAKESIYVLIDPISTHNYITPRDVYICAFKKLKHSKSWLVQIAIGTKRKVIKVVTNVHWSWMD